MADCRHCKNGKITRRIRHKEKDGTVWYEEKTEDCNFCGGTGKRR